jgi:hypothetical protein
MAKIFLAYREYNDEVGSVSGEELLDILILQGAYKSCSWRARAASVRRGVFAGSGALPFP